MVDDHGDEAVPTLVGDLVDPDAPEALEAVDPGIDVGRYPGDDRPDTSPGDAHALGDRRLGGLHGEPGDTVIEVAGVSGVVACPGDLRHRRAVGGTVDPHRRALQEAPLRSLRRGAAGVTPLPPQRPVQRRGKGGARLHGRGHAHPGRRLRRAVRPHAGALQRQAADRDHRPVNRRQPEPAQRRLRDQLGRLFRGNGLRRAGPASEHSR